MAGAAVAAVLLAGLGAAAVAGAPPVTGVTPTGYRLDQMVMATGCVDGQPVYGAPDGGLWIWRSAWAPLKPGSAVACD